MIQKDTRVIPSPIDLGTRKLERNNVVGCERLGTRFSAGAYNLYQVVFAQCLKMCGTYVYEYVVVSNADLSFFILTFEEKFLQLV